MAFWIFWLLISLPELWGDCLSYLSYEHKMEQYINKLLYYFQTLDFRSCLTLCYSMDCSPPDSSVHGILQVRILEWVAIPFSRRSSWTRDQILVSCVAGRFFMVWASREAFIILFWNLRFQVKVYKFLFYPCKLHLFPTWNPISDVDSWIVTVCQELIPHLILTVHMEGSIFTHIL